MRKAFTLVEMLLVVTIAPLMLVVISGIFKTFIQDIPRETRVVQQSTTMLDMLTQVRRDVDEAVGLPERSGDTLANERTLLISRADAVICYRFEDGRVVRMTLKGQGAADPSDQRLWRMPNAVITWQPWTRDGEAYAVEIHSHVEQRFANLLRKRLANSQVFFVNGAGKGREVR
jgi:prepilin-type N-terminal cleavage/methylation domain-containing protein